MSQWSDVPFDQPLFQNASDAIVGQATVELINAYSNEAGGLSRFPGLVPFTSGLGGNKTYLRRYRGDLYAVTDQGRVFRSDQNARVEDITAVPVSGGGRAIFAATEDELVIARGGPIIQVNRNRTRILSEDAPNSTHVAFIQGYLVAIEPFSGRFFHSAVGAYSSWNPLDVFSAEGKSDDLNAAVVTPFNELLLSGVESIEQFEPTPSGTQPFARRWVTSDGVNAPYTFLAVKEGSFGVNREAEFVRFALQTSQVESADIGLQLQKVRNWDEAWSAQIKIKGQNFFILQIPHTTSPYSDEGVTFLLDYRSKRWSTLYGWDPVRGRLTRWPGWSYETVWSRHFVGVPDGIAELDIDAYTDRGDQVPVVARTGHIDEWGDSRIDDVRIRIKRGVGTYGSTRPPQVGLRVNKDSRGWGRLLWESLGVQGQGELVIKFGMNLGKARTWQFEICAIDDAPLEFVGAQVLVERLRR